MPEVPLYGSWKAVKTYVSGVGVTALVGELGPERVSSGGQVYERVDGRVLLETGSFSVYGRLRRVVVDYQIHLPDRDDIVLRLDPPGDQDDYARRFGQRDGRRGASLGRTTTAKVVEYI